MSSKGWHLAADGMPALSVANPGCTMCRGFGLCDAGLQYGGYLVYCPTCIDVEPVAEEELGSPVG